MAEKRIERIEAFLQEAFHVIDGVEQTRVFFDETAADDLHAAGFANAALVVPVHIGAHGQLALFLRGSEKLADVFLILHRIAGAARSAGDRACLDAFAFHAHEHFGRRAHQLFVGELQQEFVRARIGALHLLKKLRGLPGICCAKGLGQHHFVVIAAPHAFAHRFHIGHVFGGRMVGGDRLGRASGRRRDLLAGAGEAARAHAILLEFVSEPLDLLALAVHVDNVVAEEELKIFAALATKAQGDGLELEEQIVTECAGKAEFVVALAAEFPRQGAQHRKHRGLLAALFFGEQSGHGPQAAGEHAASPVEAEIFPMRMVFEHAREHAADSAAALIERTKRHVPLERDQFQGWAHRYNIPA